MKVQIKKNNIVTNEASFDSQGEMNKWLDYHKSINSFGTNERVEKQELAPAVLDVDGAILVEAIMEDVIIPAEYETIIIDNSIEIQMEDLINKKAEIGEKLENDCQKCLRVITGFNDGRLTGPQIQTMLSTFGNINACLSNKMPKSAKSLIIQLVPDRTIVTQQMKDVCLYILKDYALT